MAGRKITGVTLGADQVRDYFHRCFTAVDGLWFVKVEERFGFETALDIDEQVWRVLPKIQARKFKELTGFGDGFEAFGRCFLTKLELDGFQFRAEGSADGRELTVRLERCPWLAALRKAGREHLGATIAERICRNEYGGWAKEFGGTICFSLEAKRCAGDDCCRLHFVEE